MGFFFGGFSLFSIMFTVIFVLVFGLIVVSIVRGIKQWNTNNHSPRLTVSALVVGKRMDVSHSQHPVAGDASGAHGYHTSTSTTYFVTFQVQSGDRMELRVGGKEFGLLAKGDAGNLTFQGTRFLSFDRF